MTGNPGFHRKTFGDTVVTAVSDGYLTLPNEALRGIDPAEAGAMLQAARRGPASRSSVNAVLLQSRGRTVLVDTRARATRPIPPWAGCWTAWPQPGCRRATWMRWC